MVVFTMVGLCLASIKTLLIQISFIMRYLQDLLIINFAGKLAAQLLKILTVTR